MNTSQLLELLQSYIREELIATSTLHDDYIDIEFVGGKVIKLMARAV